MEHLAAKELHITLRSRWRQKPKKDQMNDNYAGYVNRQQFAEVTHTNKLSLFDNILFTAGFHYCQAVKNIIAGFQLGNVTFTYDVNT